MSFGHIFEAILTEETFRIRMVAHNMWRMCEVKIEKNLLNNYVDVNKCLKKLNLRFQPTRAHLVLRYHLLSVYQNLDKAVKRLLDKFDCPKGVSRPNIACALFLPKQISNIPPQNRK